MERSRRLRALWNWLPAFRAVAETEHLPSAAKALAISPSALSRAVSKLEEDLGIELFEHVGRRIALNASGEILLSALRDAMRILDEAVRRVDGTSRCGTVTVSAEPALASILVLEAMAGIRQQAPGIVLRIVTIPSKNLASALERGHIDVAIGIDRYTGPNVFSDKLCSWRYGVYCAPEHALATAQRLCMADIEAHPFVVAKNRVGILPTYPPLEQAPKIGALVDEILLVADACRKLNLLAMLPDTMAQNLVRLPVEISTAVSIELSYRRPVATHLRTDAVIDAIRSSAARLMQTT